MRVSEVSNDDGKACAFLIQFLANGSWQIKGDDADKLILCKKWVHSLAVQMAEHLKTKPSEPASSPPQAMKIKAMGPIGGIKRKKK